MKPVPAVARLGVLLVAVSLLSVAVPGAVGAAFGSPPPEPVCGVCSDPFEAAAADAGVPLTVRSSDLRVRVDETGTGHWTARVTVDAAAAARFRDDPELLRAVVAATFERRRTFVDDPENLTARMDGDAAIVAFDVSGMGHPGLDGVFLVDAFDAAGATRHVYVDADRFALSGPAGTVVANDPPGATRAGGSVVWSGGDPPPDVDDGTVVAFGPDRRLTTRLAARVSIAADAAPSLLSDLLEVALFPTVLLGLGVVAVGRVGPRLPGTADAAGARRLAAAVAGLGVVWLVALAALGVLAGGLGSVGWALGVQFLAFGLLGTRFVGWVTFRRLVAVAVGVPLAAVAFVSSALGVTVSWGPLGALALAVPVALFVPLGYAARRDIERRPLVAAVVVAPTLAVLPALPLGGFAPWFVTLVLAGWALLTMAVGTLAYGLGWALAGVGAGRRASDDRPTSTA